MRTELKVGLLFNALAAAISGFGIFPGDVSEFFCGFFMALGIFLLLVNLLPKNRYDNLLYRKWIGSKKR